MKLKTVLKRSKIAEAMLDSGNMLYASKENNRHQFIECAYEDGSMFISYEKEEGLDWQPYSN